MSAKLIAAVFIAATSSAPLLAATTMIHVAMKVDPLTHIDQLGEPGKISFVMKEGKIFKDER
jgi:hypothetical protein